MKHTHLHKKVGVEPTKLKFYMLVKQDMHLPQIIGVENEDIFEPHHLGVSKKRGTPKWMEKPINMGDLGVPLFSETSI